MATIGDRVGAISHTEGETVYFFGYGVYEGDFIPDTAGGDLGKMCRDTGAPNPKITLDNGKTVWGCECWWGSEDEVKATLEGCTIVEIDIDEARKKFSTVTPLDIPEDTEYIKVMQDISETTPDLDDIKTLFRNILSDFVGAPVNVGIQGISVSLLATVSFLQAQGVLTEGLTSFSVETTTIPATEESAAPTVEVEATIGLLFPNGKRVTLTLVLKKLTTEVS